MRKRIILILALVFLAGAGAVAIVVVQLLKPKATPVRVAKVERIDTLKSVVSASGEIRSHELVDIQTEVPGVIVELPVVEGQQVKKGDMLLRIDPFQAQMDLEATSARVAGSRADVKRMQSGVASAEARLANQREQLKAAEADVAEAEITLKRDQDVLKRQKELLDSKTIPKDTYEGFEAKANVSAKRLDSSRSRLAQAKSQIVASERDLDQQKASAAAVEQDLAANMAALKRTEDQFKKVTINSPLTGTIIRLNVEVGERAVPGIQSNPQATLMTIADVTTQEAELEVDETDIVRVAFNNPATVKVDALPDDKLNAHVAEIGTAPIQKSSSSQEGKDFKVVLMIDNPTSSLRVGMSCEADITVATRENPLAVPIQALTAREVEVDAQGKYVAPAKPDKKALFGTAPSAKAAEDKGATKDKDKKKKEEKHGVFAKGKDGYAHFRVVKTGIMGESKAEVLDGLAEGEEVIIGPLKSLRVLDEWTRVEIEKSKGGELPGRSSQDERADGK